jgi:hypothetical protein
VCLQGYLRLSGGLEILDLGTNSFCGRHRRERCWASWGEGAEPLMVHVVENEGRGLGAEVGELKNL